MWNSDRNPSQEIYRPPPYQDLQDLQDLRDLQVGWAGCGDWNPAARANRMIFAAAPAPSAFAVVTTARADWRIPKIVVYTVLSYFAEICMFTRTTQTGTSLNS
jgi:hypothetical protein